MDEYQIQLARSLFRFGPTEGFPVFPALHHAIGVSGASTA